MLADPRFDTGYARVRDRYGDYGDLRFLSVDRDDDGDRPPLFLLGAPHGRRAVGLRPPRSATFDRGR